MSDVVTVGWSRNHLDQLKIDECVGAYEIDVTSLIHVLHDRNIWDQCPVLNENLEIACIGKKELWIFLSAPKDMLGDERHHYNRLSLALFDGTNWQDCGFLMPDGFSRGSREWAATAHLDNHNQLSLYYTAAGLKSEQEVSFTQRLFTANASLETRGEHPKFSNWRNHEELFKTDGLNYDTTNNPGRANGGIKAFRDPFYFKDPKTDLEYILFSGTNPNSESEFDACIGIAERSSDANSWQLLPPLVNSEGVSYELERAHVIHKAGKYYLFWSMHGWTSSDVVNVPTGLYGMVSNSILGPYEPLNGSGLVIANPRSNPFQAYSWNVCTDFSVSSFVDLPNAVLEKSDAGITRPIGEFSGSLAPNLNITVDGSTTCLRHSTLQN